MPLSGRDIVCFANDWSGDPLSKQHVMRRLARRNRVLWVNSLGNRAPRIDLHDMTRLARKLTRFAGGVTAVEHNIHVLSPLAVPFYQSSLLRRVNEQVVGATVRGAMQELGFRDSLLYTFVPASAWVAGRLGERHIVYHCVDEYSAFAGAGRHIAALEADLLSKSDLVIACSEALQRSKRRLNRNTVLVRHGVEHAHFARALDPATTLPADIQGLPRPIFGFYGLLAEWVDLRAMRRVAEEWPQGSVVVLGEINHPDPMELERLRARENVHLLGRRPYSSLPSYCKGFDVALLPFVKNELTESANPLKLREYLAAGLPVVATDIPEARTLAAHGVYLADGTESFIARAKEALVAGPGPLHARSAALSSESWDDQVAKIEAELLRLS